MGGEGGRDYKLRPSGSGTNRPLIIGEGGKGEKFQNKQKRFA